MTSSCKSILAGIVCTTLGGVTWAAACMIRLLLSYFLIIDQYDSDGTVFRESDLLDDLVCQLCVEGFQAFILFNNASKLIFNVCLVTDLTVAQGGSLEQLFPKGILVEVISLKCPCDLVVKASLLDGQLLLAVSIGMDHLGVADQSTVLNLW